MASPDNSDRKAGLYERRIGTPTTTDEVNGYWLFGFGVLLGLAGVAMFFVTGSQTTMRGIAYALAALAPPFVMLGAVIRFPLRRAGTYLGYLGIAVSVLGVVWFLNIFPNGWSTTSGNSTVITLYGVGLLLIGLAGTIVPLLSDPVYEDYERMQSEAAAATAERDETSAELEAARAELASTEDELAAAEERAADLDAAAATARAEAESLRESKARFELFEDASGKPRWRLRHRNGNVIATSGQGYSSRGKAQQGLHSVRRNARGAGLLRIEAAAAEAAAVAADDGPEPEDADEPAVAVPTEDAATSDATFELFADAADEWRWRLRHRNGTVVGNSGEGYASKSNAKRALGRVRENVAAADYLRVDPAAFEMFRDAAGKWRWRLIHENGEILADSGQGYASRSKARQGLDSVRSNAAEAALDDGDEAAEDAGGANATFELYEDKGDEYRWRLRHRNGNLVADSGEGYASKSNARDAIERVRGYAPDADVLEVGTAAFEIYEDAADEWRWRLRHRNGNVIAASGKGYASRSNATEAVTRVKETAPGAGEEVASDADEETTE